MDNMILTILNELDVIYKDEKVFVKTNLISLIFNLKEWKNDFKDESLFLFRPVDRDVFVRGLNRQLRTLSH